MGTPCDTQHHDIHEIPKRALHPEGGASALVCFRFIENKLYVLAVRKRSNPSKWFLPGGRREAGETPLDTVLREMEEETGCVFARARKYPKRVISFLESVPKEQEGDKFKYHFFLAFFDSVDRIDESKVNKEEIQKREWIDVERVLTETEEDLPFDFYHKTEIVGALRMIVTRADLLPKEGLEACRKRLTTNIPLRRLFVRLTKRAKIRLPLPKK